MCAMNMDIVEVDGQKYALRRARVEDIDPILELVQNDEFREGEPKRKTGAGDRHLAAFYAIDSDPAHLLVVIEDAQGRVVGTMQLTILPGLCRGGASRLQLEEVRVADQLRGKGLGTWMIRWAIAEGERRGAKFVQLTSNQSRKAAHRFYERLGFNPTHVGFKRWL